MVMFIGMIIVIGKTMLIGTEKANVSIKRNTAVMCCAATD